MEAEQVKMYQISKLEQPNNNDNVVLRALVGNPTRHKPLVHHPPPSSATSQEIIPATMYTLETRYRSIPPKALPNSSETTLYHIDSKKGQQPLAPSPPIMKEERDTPVPVEREAPNNVEDMQESAPIIFLEPKIISQPILYSIVGAKKVPIQKDQPIAVNKEMPSPLLYTITGHIHQPTTNMTENALNVETSVIDKSPILYSLVGGPRLQVHFQEPNKQVLSLSEQPAPSLYSVVGSPTLTPHITQTNAPNLPLSQSVKVSSVEQAPILYTIVGETQVPTNISNETSLPPAPVKKQGNDVIKRRVIDDSNIPQLTTVPHKTQPLQPQQQTLTPTLYTLVGKPSSAPHENANTRLKQPVRRKTPPPSTMPTTHISRSVERQPPSELVTKAVTPIPPIKTKRHAKSKEPTIPKSETIFIPLSEREYLPRPKQPRTIPSKIESGQIHRKPFTIAQHDPLQIPDYISPYAYHPSRPYREQTYNPISLPIVASNRSSRKPRVPLYESRNQKYPYDPWSHHSLERYPVKTKEPSRLWDYEDPIQTDTDDNDTNDSSSQRRKRYYRRIRPRTPWLPVW